MQGSHLGGMDFLTAALTAIGLAACAGLRAFLPIFGIGVAARLLHWQMQPPLDVLASDTGLVIFGLAAVLEVAADKIPVVDNALDAIHTILGPLVGVLAAYIPFSTLPPAYALALAIMTGVTVAGGVHALAATTRIQSSLLTMGVANPVLSLLEDAFVLATLAVTILAPLVLLFLLGGAIIWIRRRGRIRLAS